MNDAVGNLLAVGDDVLYADVLDGSVVFRRAVITRFTPQKIGITYSREWETPHGNTMTRHPSFLTVPTRVVLYHESETCDWCGQPPFSGADE